MSKAMLIKLGCNAPFLERAESVAIHEPIRLTKREPERSKRHLHTTGRKSRRGLAELTSFRAANSPSPFQYNGPTESHRFNTITFHEVWGFHGEMGSKRRDRRSDQYFFGGTGGI